MQPLTRRSQLQSRSSLPLLWPRLVRPLLHLISEDGAGHACAFFSHTVRCYALAVYAVIGATVDAVERIPLISNFLEFVGLAVVGVYGYRYITDPAER